VVSLLNQLLVIVVCLKDSSFLGTNVLLHVVIGITSDVFRKNFPEYFKFFRKISGDNYTESFHYFLINIIVDNNNNNASKFINITSTVLFMLQCLIVQ